MEKDLINVVLTPETEHQFQVVRAGMITAFHQKENVKYDSSDVHLSVTIDDEITLTVKRPPLKSNL